MSQLRTDKLHLRLDECTDADGPITPRRYTLTHSDTTGDRFITIGPEFDKQQVAGWYTRLMRDEVLAAWLEDENGVALHVYCHVSGGLVFGPAGFRDVIFRRLLPSVLAFLRYGDREFFAAHPELDQAPIYVHFQSTHKHYDRIECWGAPGDYGTPI